jgi:hypothetical protein
VRIETDPNIVVRVTPSRVVLGSTRMPVRGYPCMDAGTGTPASVSRVGAMSRVETTPS